MKLTVRLFAAARDLAGQSEALVELSPGADVAAVRNQLALQFPRLQPLVARSLVAVNSEYAVDASPVAEGDEVALIPPVSGG
jgi:molybdopterin converting factor subunit 1